MNNDNYNDDIEELYQYCMQTVPGIEDKINANKERDRIRLQKYNKSPKKKEAQKKYRESIKYKEYKKKYYIKNREIICKRRKILYHLKKEK